MISPTDMALSYKEPAKAKLSIIIPAYNSERWIISTIEQVIVATSKAGWKSGEIIVVDDGSTDKTASIIRSHKSEIPTKVITQKNLGRFKAREAGLKVASGDYILLLDSRVETSPGSIEYVFKKISKDRDAVVWNGHILMDRKHNPFARFWYTVTFLAWRRYMRHPRLVHYGIEEFDYYPKGTTGFLAPKKLLLKAYSNFHTAYKDVRYANDDTSLIRYIAEQTDIYMAPEYSFTYVSRSTLRAFIPHTLHRGIVFIDGHFHRGNRYYYACLAYLLAVPLVLLSLILYPLVILLILPVLVLVFVIAKVMGAETADAAALAYIMPVFALFYTVGLYRGIYLATQK